MISLLWPWAFAVLPLPFLLRLVIPRTKKSNDAALRVAQLSDFQLSDDISSAGRAARWPFLLYSLAWICLVTALARPQWTGDVIEIPVSGRDLMLAIDTSRSMEAMDFTVDFTSSQSTSATLIVFDDGVPISTVPGVANGLMATAGALAFFAVAGPMSLTRLRFDSGRTWILSSLGATLLPSRQGARLDPVEALRYE